MKKDRWTIIAVDKTTGIATPFQIGYWNMQWRSPKAAEKIVKEYQADDDRYTLKVVLDVGLAYEAYNKSKAA